jgi:hypothetical protein
MIRKKNLQDQVEKIIDEGDGERRTVIVQMASDEQVDRQLLTLAATVHRRRNLSLTSRDVLPAEHQELENLQMQTAGTEGLTILAERTLEGAEASLAVQVGTRLLPTTANRLRQVVGNLSAPCWQTTGSRRRCLKPFMRNRTGRVPRKSRKMWHYLLQVVSSLTYVRTTLLAFPTKTSRAFKASFPTAPSGYLTY